MRISPVILFLAAASLSSSAHAQHGRHEVVGYYPSWKLRADANLFSPERIPFGGLTVINYAFFFPLPDGTIRGRDSAGDAAILSGDTRKDGSAASQSLTALAHHRGVRVLLSIGGWEDSGNFPAVAADSSCRIRFAASCTGAIREYGFDGIDIDWEFPGLAEHNGTPADAMNFVRLLRILRRALEAEGHRNGRHLLLTAALPADSSRAEGMTIREAAPLLDFLNVMTYDMYGPWDAEAYHNAPLFAGPGGNSARTVDGAFRLYTATFGIPAAKINLGVPFYGHSYTGCTELNGPHGPSDTVHFPGGGATYSAIASRMKEFTKHWDDRASVPYLTSSTWNMLVSYDDAESAADKARYVVDRGARGLIIWEITQDCLPDGTHPLLDAINGVFHEAH